MRILDRELLGMWMQHQLQQETDVPLAQEPDISVWKFGAKGECTVHSFYVDLRTESDCYLVSFSIFMCSFSGTHELNMVAYTEKKSAKAITNGMSPRSSFRDDHCVRC